MTGECLAVIPREAILSCTNSTVASVVEKEVELQQITSSWVPLLIALAAECSLKVSGIRVLGSTIALFFVCYHEKVSYNNYNWLLYSCVSSVHKRAEFLFTCTT